jgi:peptide/nickel transport system substrate-binding protein/oligopeptide transport system substrate-binding protein
MYRYLRFTFLLLLVSALCLLNPLYVFAGKEETKEQSSPKPAARYGGTYRRALGHEPPTLDPAKISDVYSEVVSQQVFEGLVQYSENLMIVPGLAESWDSSRDNLRWTFRLREGVLFHNGRELVADDFVYTFTRLLDPATETGMAQFMTAIRGAEAYHSGTATRVEGLTARDRYTLEIQLEEAFPPFITMLAQVNMSVVPREEVERWGDEFGKHPVGTGPFVFDHWDPESEIVLTANSEYHEGRPFLDGIEFRIYPGASIEDMFEEFEKGNLEDSQFPAGERERVISEGTYPVLRRPGFITRFLAVNNATPPLDNRLVRQAANYTIDKQQVASQAGKGRLAPATGLIPLGMAGYRPENLNYPYSPARTRQLLAEAGYPGAEGLPALQIWSSVRSEALLVEDRLIQEYLEAAGFEVEFNYLLDWPVFQKRFQQGEFPVFKYAWEPDVPDPDNIIASLFHSKSPNNIFNYSNPDVDELITRAQNERDYERRIALYSEAQELILADAPIILLSNLAYERVFQPYVRNYEGKAIGDHYFSLKRVWLEKQTPEAEGNPSD